MKEIEENDKAYQLTRQIVDLFKIATSSDNDIDLFMDHLDLNSHFFIFFILSLYRDDILSETTFEDYENLDKKLRALIYESDLSIKLGYPRIFDARNPIIPPTASEILKNLFEATFKIDKDVLKENFAYCIDLFLFEFGVLIDEPFQPKEITKLIGAIVDLPENAKVYNPYAENGSYILELGENRDVYAQAKSSSWAFEMLRLMAHQSQQIKNFVAGDSSLNWPGIENKFDLIISTPPISYKPIKHLGLVLEKFNNNDINEFLKKGINSLNKNGKLISLIPLSYFTKISKDLNIVKEFIDKDFIDTIIVLPTGLAINQGNQTAVLILKANKTQPGKLRFINAENNFELNDRMENVLNYKQLISVYHDPNQDSKLIKVVENQDIVRLNYNLNYKRYFLNKIEGIKLKNILIQHKGPTEILPKEGKLIRIRDLSNSEENYYLDISKVKESNFQGRKFRTINKPCLLVATRWKSLKPTLYYHSNLPIFITNDVLSFKIDTNLVDPRFLVTELQKDYVKEQLDAYRIGVSTAMLRKDDLLQVIVKLPSLEQQKAKVESLEEVSEKIKKLEKERNALAHGQSDNHFNEMASLKHTLGRPRQNILDWTDNLLDFFQGKEDLIRSLNKSFSDFYSTDILSVLKEIKNDVNFMTEVLEMGENGLSLKDYEKTFLSFDDLNSLLSDISGNNFNFKLEKVPIYDSDMEAKGIEANSTLLKALIDNLLTNANKHGFGKSENGNEVTIQLNEMDDSLILEVKNNGKPFPKGFTKEKFITKFSTSDKSTGSGIGGFDINRIAVYFGDSDWDLILNASPIYPVIFKFHFPINFIN